MALEKSFLSNDGVTHTNAYHKIVDLKVERHGTVNKKIKIIVAVYHTKANRDAGDAMLNGKPVGYSLGEPYYTTYFDPKTVLDLVGNNPIKQAYVYLKALVTIPAEPINTEDPNYAVDMQNYQEALNRAVTVNDIQNYYNNAVDVLE